MADDQPSLATESYRGLPAGAYALVTWANKIAESKEISVEAFYSELAEALGGQDKLADVKRATEGHGLEIPDERLEAVAKVFQLPKIAILRLQSALRKDAEIGQSR